MPIWIGDWLNGRKELEDDRLVLVYGKDEQIMAHPVVTNGLGLTLGKPSPWHGPIPPEHPDDVAFDNAHR